MKTYLKHLPILALPVVFSLMGCASTTGKTSQYKAAAIGQTESQITKELGSPTTHYMNGFDLFHDEGNEVQAHFDGGKADALFYYTFDKKISEPWLSSVLKLNSQGIPWLLEAKSSSGRMVYHTTDGKFYAFVSEGNQLLVDTRSFFQRSLHQCAKTILIDDLPECIFAPDHGIASLGKTPSSVMKAYGQPIGAAADGAKEYYDGYQSIVVHYKGGYCDAVLYSVKKPQVLNDCTVSHLLRVNSIGNVWIVSENSKPNSKFYWTPCRNFIHLAAHLIKRRRLFVYTTDFSDQRFTSLGKKAPKIKTFPATITPCAPVCLDETEVAMTRKLGPPTIEEKVRVYRDGDLIIRASFEHGICNKIIYISEKKKKFSEHWVSSTLAVNARGRAWLVRESSGPKMTYYNTYDDKFYARLKGGNNLGIFTEKVIHQVIAQMNEKKRKAASASPSTSQK